MQYITFVAQSRKVVFPASVSLTLRLSLITTGDRRSVGVLISRLTFILAVCVYVGMHTLSNVHLSYVWMHPESVCVTVRLYVSPVCCAGGTVLEEKG